MTKLSDLADGFSGAVISAALLTGTFGLATLARPMPPTERGAALTAFLLLTLAYTLQGSRTLYELVGRTVRRDLRALISLLALIPMLYLSYSSSVDEFSWAGLITAIAFVFLPTLAVLQSRGEPNPTLLDLVAALYLWISLEFHLIPRLMLPQQGGEIAFFAFAAAPLMLLLLAARGWYGIGFVWFLKLSDLRVALITGVGVCLLLTPLALAVGMIQRSMVLPPVPSIFLRAILIYFLIALPQEIFFRGIIQNGIERALATFLRRFVHRDQHHVLFQDPQRTAQFGSLVLASFITGLSQLSEPSSAISTMPYPLVLAMLAALAYGWTYQRTRNLVATAIPHTLLVWCWTIFFA